MYSGLGRSGSLAVLMHTCRVYEFTTAKMGTLLCISGQVDRYTPSTLSWSQVCSSVLSVIQQYPMYSNSSSSPRHVRLLTPPTPLLSLSILLHLPHCSSPPSTLSTSHADPLPSLGPNPLPRSTPPSTAPIPYLPPSLPFHSTFLLSPPPPLPSL